MVGWFTFEFRRFSTEYGAFACCVIGVFFCCHCILNVGHLYIARIALIIGHFVAPVHGAIFH
jgi:hypothetical protein